MASMRYVSGDGYSRMFEPEPEPEPEETPEEAEFRMLRAALSQRAGGLYRLTYLELYAPIFGVAITADVLHRAILACDDDAKRGASALAGPRQCSRLFPTGRRPSRPTAVMSRWSTTCSTADS